MILDRYKDIINLDYPLYVDIIDLIKSNEYDVVYDSGTTLILRGRVFPYYVEITKDIDECLEVLKKLDVHILICRNPEIYQYYLEKGFECNKCYQVYYSGNIKGNYNGLNIIKPKDEDIELINKYYPHGDYEYLKKCSLDGRLFALYIDSKMAGFIGVHEEGSCGMLHVMDEFRNQGYAMKLEQFIFDNRLRNNRIPYGQVIIDNIKSIKLQRKMNSEISKGMIYWMWEKENNNK